MFFHHYNGLLFSYGLHYYWTCFFGPLYCYCWWPLIRVRVTPLLKNAPLVLCTASLHYVAIEATVFWAIAISRTTSWQYNDWYIASTPWTFTLSQLLHYNSFSSGVGTSNSDPSRSSHLVIVVVLLQTVFDWTDWVILQDNYIKSAFIKVQGVLT